MDPTAALALILEGLEPCEDKDWAPGETVEALRNLADWLERGGFRPDLYRAIDDAGCGAIDDAGCGD